MPDDNANQTAPKDGKPPAADETGNTGKPAKTPPKDGKPPAAATAATTAPAFKIGEPTGNLTRDSIIETVRGKHMADGKSEDEAHELALKRGFEMVKDG